MPRPAENICPSNNAEASRDHIHSHGVYSQTRQQAETRYRWQIHHPVDGIKDRVAVEVSPWNGLLPRWRFIIPADYDGMVRWGVARSGSDDPDHEAVRRPVTSEPVQLMDGPDVKWVGGHNPLSASSLSAVFVFQGEPPHYLGFGQAAEPDGPPASVEGIYFQAHHHSHP